MKKIDKFGFVSILITIVLLNIYIGSNVKSPIWIIQIFMSFVSIIYIILKKIDKEKNVIIKGKIDIAVIILMISMFIPFIAKTYASLDGTINIILKYWSIYGIYILTRNVITEKKQIEIILKTFIISSIIPLIFGYDKFLNLNFFEPFLNLIGAIKLNENRFISTFGYANTCAIYFAVITTVTIYMYKTEKNKKIKYLYLTYILICSITILLTQSKGVIGISGLVIFIYVIIGIKNKKISKKWIIAGICAIIVFVIYFFIAIQIPKDLIITEKNKTCVVREFEPNTKYKLELEIETNTDKQYDSCKIVIVEITKYLSEKELTKFSFSNYNGWKSFEIETDDVASYIEIRILNPTKQTINIKGFKINDKQCILEYKIIPDELVRIFKNFNFKYTSVFQRFDYWKDGLKIVKENFLFGAGGNAWRMLYGQVQDYLYYAKESHCYLIELIISYGLTGFLAYIFIIAITVKNGSKLLKDKLILSIITGILMIIVHSLIDFDMSFLIILSMFFMFIAIINKNDKNLKISVNLIDYILIPIFAIILIANICGYITSSSEKEKNLASINIAPWLFEYKYNDVIYMEKNNINSVEKLEKIKKILQNEPYSCQNTLYEIFGNTLEKIDDENVKKQYVDFMVDFLQKYKVERIHDSVILKNRADAIIQIYEKSGLKTDEAKKLLKIVIDEYDETAKGILEYEKNMSSKTISKMRFEIYISSYEKALELYEEKD